MSEVHDASVIENWKAVMRADEPELAVFSMGEYGMSAQLPDGYPNRRAYPNRHAYLSAVSKWRRARG